MKKSNDQRVVLLFISLILTLSVIFAFGFFVGYNIKEKQVIIIEKDFGKIDIELLGDCLNEKGCIIVLKNTGSDTINTTDIKIYKDDTLYATADMFTNDHNTSFDHISANKSIAVRVGNICDDTDLVSAVSKVRTVSNSRVLSWYRSTILCPENLSSYEQPK